MSHLFDKNRARNLCQSDFSDGLLTPELHFPLLDLRETVCLISGHTPAYPVPECFLTEVNDNMNWLWLYAPENVSVTSIS